ncbi:hypothetical protein ACFL35_18195 [Candidatus Riflebacteria bacterium]
MQFLATIVLVFKIGSNLRPVLLDGFFLTM